MSERSYTVRLPARKVYAAARRARIAIYKARLRELRRAAEETCKPCWLSVVFRKLFRQEPPPAPTEAAIRQEMRSIVENSRNGLDIHDIRADGWRMLCGFQLHTVNSLIMACRAAHVNGMMELSDTGVDALNGFLIVEKKQ